MKLIKFMIQLWIATSLIKAIAASNQRTRFEGRCLGFENGIACGAYDEDEPPYSLAFREVA
jgi:hypothetical protein